MVKIIRVDEEGKELDIARLLFKEYSDELNENLCFQSFDAELNDPLKKYGWPKGSLFLAYLNDEAVGCIALQPLKESGVCEMKRLYVQPKFRGDGIAKKLVHALVKDAKDKGYNKMVLDTLQRLQPAIKLYLKEGFTYAPAYYANPLANVVYMERDL